MHPPDTIHQEQANMAASSRGLRPICRQATPPAHLARAMPRRIRPGCVLSPPLAHAERSCAFLPCIYHGRAGREKARRGGLSGLASTSRHRDAGHEAICRWPAALARGLHCSRPPLLAPCGRIFGEIIGWDTFTYTDSYVQVTCKSSVFCATCQVAKNGPPDLLSKTRASLFNRS